jgi:hypothetical protein
MIAALDPKTETRHEMSMNGSSLVRRLSLGFVVVLCVACGESAADDDDDTSAAGESGSMSTASSGGSGGATHGGSGGKSARDAGSPATEKKDAGKPGSVDSGTRHAGDEDGGAPEPDAGSGLQGIGSCCAAHDTPGCSNADLQVCVCEKLPSCCTEAWDENCVYVVENKYCQEGVRDCVCGSEEGQWGRTACCEADWSSTCDSVAEIKCGALAGCF